MTQVTVHEFLSLETKGVCTRLADEPAAHSAAWRLAYHSSLCDIGPNRLGTRSIFQFVNIEWRGLSNAPK